MYLSTVVLLRKRCGGFDVFRDCIYDFGKFKTLQNSNSNHKIKKHIQIKHDNY